MSHTHNPPHVHYFSEYDTTSPSMILNSPRAGRDCAHTGRRTRDQCSATLTSTVLTAYSSTDRHTTREHPHSTLYQIYSYHLFTLPLQLFFFPYTPSNPLLAKFSPLNDTSPISIINFFLLLFFVQEFFYK